jgi:predicted nucleic acid-binding Zn ribbon protein
VRPVCRCDRGGGAYPAAVPADGRRFGSSRPRPRARGPVRPQAAAPVSSDALMGEVLARLGGAGRAREFRAFDCYARAVGETFRARTQPERLAGTTLMVRVASSALAHELTLLRAEILARMTAELGPNVVTELRTRVGPIAPKP